ncbi:uncharacterized protein RJT21DRAFT_134439 [Scheffersomyces amazonensis]|uniref:uncharacterized protein n=1 Tax=Scheffersomyces amazonensis TaxID=1078765 RepID=UPI00315CA28A
MTDVYIVVNIATTCDESNTYVTKDSTEIIEFSWSTVDASTTELLHKNSILVRPVNTPITPYCSQLHKLTWEHVRNAGTFKDAIQTFDEYVQVNLINNNKSFIFVTMDLKSFKIQLPREARDKSIVLPSYLQMPKVFDLNAEYSKWQVSHPESLSYPSSSLVNIITALQVDISQAEIEELNSTANNNTSPTTETNSDSATNQTLELLSNLSSSKSALLTSIYAKILTQLIKKSLPIEEYPNVLTKPYDFEQDIKIFLSERSKILYLSNLSNDTTQSELESWFTQYGGRPIAFWTIKNLESSKPKSNGISGFAVFSTHEEATESLSMNGKVFNDRPIEVQPSSTKVLDKASDLLTPFPPSKNRPRPGDWTCPSCGFSNFQRRTHCFRCSFPASSAVAIQESIYSNPAQNSNNSGGNLTPSSSRRNAVINAAAILSNSNNNSNSINNNINSYNSNLNVYNGSNGHLPDHSQSQQQHQQQPQQQQQQQQNYHNNLNYNNNNNNNNNGSSNNNGNLNNNNNHNRMHYNSNNVPFRAGDWKCEYCTYHNFAKNLCCLKCGANKPASLQNNNNAGNASSAAAAAAAAAASANNIHSVNSTAAAIAAATASGQPLNLSNGLLSSLQQPQPHHAGQYLQQPPRQQSRNNSLGSTTSTQYSTSSNNSGGKSILGQQHYQQHQSNYNGSSSLRGSGNGTPQPLQQQSYLQNLNKYSNSVNNSPGLYPTTGYASNQYHQQQHHQHQQQQHHQQQHQQHQHNNQQQQGQYLNYNKQNPATSNSLPLDSNPNAAGNKNTNAAFNVLTSQVNSLSLNH